VDETSTETPSENVGHNRHRLVDDESIDYDDPDDGDEADSAKSGNVPNNRRPTILDDDDENSSGAVFSDLLSLIGNLRSLFVTFLNFYQCFQHPSICWH
jgi:hypothetical protein